jgi:hypothetical protein
MTRHERRRTRLVAAAELGVGALLVGRGPQCWQVISGTAPRALAAAGSRILGVRLLVQGSSQLLWPTHLRQTWAAIDLAHAATMTLLALSRGPARRPALISGTVAAVNGWYGWRRAHRS